jgi:hypothetical protein
MVNLKTKYDSKMFVRNQLESFEAVIHITIQNISAIYVSGLYHQKEMDLIFPLNIIRV